MNIKVNFKAGGSFTRFRPVFSTNSETIYVAWKNSVLSYSVKTGCYLSEYTGLSGDLVGFGVHLYNGYECITACSSLGQLASWECGTQYKIINEQLEIQNIKTCNILPSPYDENMEILLTQENENGIGVIIVNIKKGTQIKLDLVINKNKPYFLDIGGNKNYFAVAQRGIIIFVDLKTLNIKRLKTSKKNVVTCLQCHPEEEAVLIGDSLGENVIYTDLFAPQPVKTIYHWHTLPVQCVAFSPSGTTFYTGGKECVLVKWQTDNVYERKFLPRLTSTIEQISVSPNNLFVAVVTDDNSIKIIDQTFEQVSLIENLSVGDHFEAGIVFDPRTKALVMNAFAGHIQFYTPNDRKLIYKIDIVGQNKIPQERNMKIETTQVTKIAINKLGTWMATVEERKDWKYFMEIRLKFWKFNLIKQTYELNTVIDYPHEKSINSIQFQLTTNVNELKCITVGDDNYFKVWQMIQDEENVCWRSLCTGYFRQLPCRGLSFSSDGSLVAIGFGCMLTTWVPDNCDLKCSLVHPNFREQIKSVEFGRSSQCHLLVGASDIRVSVWNLLTLQVVWTVPVKMDILLASNWATHMAIITKDRQLIVFNPDNPKPIYQSTSKLLKDHEKIYASAIIPVKSGNESNLKWWQRMPIYFIGKDKELYSIGQEDDIEESTKVEDEQPTSLFSKILPQTKKSIVEKVEPVEHKFKEDSSLKKYFDRTLYTMVPIRITCEALIKPMILKKIQPKS